jgi:hypothetical protein
MQVHPGSILQVSSNYVFYEQKRTRKPDEPRRPGTIGPGLMADTKYDVEEFLAFISRRYGAGSAGKLSVLDMKMFMGQRRGLASNGNMRAEHAETCW